MRKATPSDKQLILDILTPAFDTNKSVNYIAKQDHNRVKRIRGLMEYAFNMCYAFGDVWLANDGRACALVLFTEKKKTSLRTILWDMRLAFSVVGLSRVNKILKREAMIKANQPKQPFAYLWFLGVDRSTQGKGVGSSLMKELITFYKEQGLPIYLETSMEVNIPFYENLGFEVFNTVQLSYKLYMIRSTNRQA